MAPADLVDLVPRKVSELLPRGIEGMREGTVPDGLLGPVEVRGTLVDEIPGDRDLPAVRQRDEIVVWVDLLAGVTITGIRSSPEVRTIRFWSGSPRPPGSAAAHTVQWTRPQATKEF